MTEETLQLYIEDVVHVKMPIESDEDREFALGQALEMLEHAKNKIEEEDVED